jgi:hypothetical protein
LKRVTIELKPVIQVAAEDDNISAKSHRTSLEAVSIWKTTSKAINMEEDNHKKL